MPDQFLPAPFPTRGLDVSHAHGSQPPGTTPRGKNVRVCEPSTMRLRGGSRPGMVRYVPAQIPEGSEQIQELNAVVISAVDAIDTGVDDPGTLTFDDPSSDGPPSSWGTFPLGFPDPYGTDPITDMTGAREGTRNPYGSGGARSKRRDKGSGFQPNKNVVTGTQPSPTEHHCFQGSLTIEIFNPPPDIGGFTGQKPVFAGEKCAPYISGNPLFTGIHTALVCVTDLDDVIAPAGTLLPDYIAYWLWVNVGHDSQGTVIADRVGPASPTTCTGDSTCNGADPPDRAGTGAGAVITAKAPGT